MRRLLFLLVILPSVIFAQTTDSWVRFAVQYDFYAPQESNFFMVEDTISGDTVMFHQPTVSYEYLDTILNLNSGSYIVTLTDNYGDGWLSSQPAWFKMMNDCQGPIINFDPLTQQFFTLDTLVNILPCAPPISGCMNFNATNYDSTATIDDGSCLYAVDFVLDMNSFPGTFTTPFVTGEFVNWTDSLPMVDPDGDNVWEYTATLPSGQYLWKYMLDNWADQELPQLGPNSSCFQPDGQGFINRTLNVIDSGLTLPQVCWESCLPCGAILGCTDQTSANYNPWANIDDGSCIVIPSCPAGETPIAIVVIPDNYGGELSWKLYGDSGLVAEAPTGTYSGAQPGLPISTFVCVDTTQMYDLVIEDSYGDGLCGTCFGGTTDGTVVILDCDENVIYNLQDDFPDGNFNFLATSPQFQPAVCDTYVPIGGCTNPLSTTFNVDADFDDGTCGPPRIVGCTDSTSFNFDPNANTSETILGQYTLEIFDGASDGWGGTWLGLQQGSWISPQYKMGAQDGNSISFQVSLNIYEPIQAYLFVTPQSVNSIDQIAYKLTGPTGDTLIEVLYWDAIPFPYILEVEDQPTFGDVCIPIIYGCTDSAALNYVQPTGDPLVDANTNDNSCISIIYGCTNTLAFNYDSTANVDDNSCIPIINGCMDTSAYNYNPLANTEDFSCIYLGCTDAIACNYDSQANVDNGGCIYPIQYYDCNGNCLNDTDGDGVCDELEILGCTNPLSINFNPAATEDDGTCIPYVYGCTDSTQYNYNPLANTDDGTCIPYIYGCTDPTAFNFDPLANTNDNSCIPVIIGCMDPTMFNYDPTANTSSGNCIPFIYGCTDSTQFNYNPLANTDNGTCEPFVYGCTDNTALNFDPLANTLDNTCCYIAGCTDPTALNYDPDACFDDNTCITIVTGCTDVSAYNYNPAANVSDSAACLYDAGCYGGPGIPYWLNDGCYAWVINVDDYCCTNDWDASCQSMYDYCQQGWPVSIEEAGSGTILVYPNPTANILNIETRLDIDVEVYTMTGKLVLTESKTNRIDFRGLKPGIYNLVLIHNDKIRINKRVIKQ